jgi:hypothetical protein
LAYEAEMTIVFDAQTRTCVVSFRGTLKILRGPFLNRAQTILAGEAYCRERGWVE